MKAHRMAKLLPVRYPVRAGRTRGIALRNETVEMRERAGCPTRANRPRGGELVCVLTNWNPISGYALMQGTGGNFEAFALCPG